MKTTHRRLTYIRLHKQQTITWVTPIY